MSCDCDVVIAGGGPAGSTAASALARSGRSVQVFERDRFPRFHIGESLLASVNEVLAAIGASERIAAAGFPQKWGATFVTPDGAVERFADFAVAREVRMPQTWQVHRAEFDRLLLDHARASGASVHEGMRIVGVDFDADGVTVTARPAADAGDPGAAAREVTVRARAIIDASGRTGLLSRRFDLRVPEPALQNIAIFSHYAGVPRAEGRRAGDIRVVARADPGWFWLIPISDELMSVGVVLPRAAFDRLPKLPHEALLDRAIAETPAVARLMSAAERRWPVRVEKDFSYGSRAYAGDRWLLAGDAGSFLDPVFSSGVAIAMESGYEAALAIDAALAAGNLSAGAFARFDIRQRRRYAAFRRFVLGFYSHGFRDLFFSPDPPPHMFRAVVTVLAGYWRPSVATRFALEQFFLAVRLQERLGFATAYAPRVPLDDAAGLATSGSAHA